MPAAKDGAQVSGGTGRSEQPLFHSVTLDPSRCIGCTTCIKKCPTEAIRVRKGRAWIIETRCIDCGECVRTCPQGAKKTVSDPLSSISGFAFRVAIPAPSLFAQYEARHGRDAIIEALLTIGFDDVFEVARAAEIVGLETARLLGESGPRPLISTACPAVVRLIQLRYPSLIQNLAGILPPVEVAARIVREQLHPGREGLGVFFISPCACKVTSIRKPLGYEGSAVDGVIGIKDIFHQVRRYLERRSEGLITPPALNPEARGFAHVAGKAGLGWARAEGEIDALLPGPQETSTVSVDGIDNVITLLEGIENGKIENIDYLEALACPGGCVGGPMTVGDPFVSKARVRERERLMDRPDDKRGQVARDEKADDPVAREPGSGGLKALSTMRWTMPIRSQPALTLDPDLLVALEKAEEMEKLASGLPGLDCGSCGAPSCRALAEDIVRGEAVATDCIFKLRENVRSLAEELLALETMVPPGLDRGIDRSSDRGSGLVRGRQSV